MGFNVSIINPTVGASEYGANLAQWDWNPAKDTMEAAKTTYAMLQSSKEEARKQEEFELEKILFPTKQKAAELQLEKIRSEINENNARADALLGQADADGLAGYSLELNNERLSHHGVYFPLSLNPYIPKQKSSAAAISSNAVPVPAKQTKQTVTL